MSQPTTTGTNYTPTYHQNLLIARFRPEAIEPITTMMSATGALPTPERLPGLTILQKLEQNGLVKQVTPIGQLGEESVHSGYSPMAGAIINSRPAPVNGDPTAGVNLIRLDEAADTEKLEKAMKDDPTVEHVARVPVRYLSPVGGSGQAAVPTPQWNLGRIAWNKALEIPNLKDASDIRVAILDTGVQVDHPDLNGRITRYTYEHSRLPVPAREHDISGHGTHVAGIIGALRDNDIGINGLSDAQLLVWKIFNDAAYQFIGNDEQGQDWFAPVVDPLLYYSALADCVREKVDVINLSIGGSMPPDAVEQQLFDRLRSNGTVIVAAMGNERQFGSPVTYPAALDGVLAVGATDPEDSVAAFSNGGEHINICAPGVGIWSTVPTYPGQGFITMNNATKTLRRQMRKVEFAAWNGTSMATPHVTAAVAMLLANQGKMHPESVCELLAKTADKLPNMGNSDWHPDYGSGLLNIQRLLTTEVQ